MSSLPTQMYAALEALMVGAWPGLVEVIEEETLEEVPWEAMTPPFGTVIVSDPRPDNGPTATIGFLMPVSLTYMAEVGENTQREDQRQKVEDMIVYLQAHPLSFGQVMSIDGMAWGKSIEANAIFVAKNYAHRLAILEITVRWGYAGGLP